MWHAIHEYKRQELQIRHMRWRTAGAWVAVAIALMALAKPEIVTLWKGLVAVSEGKSIPQPGPALPKTEPEKRTSLPNEQQNKARVERNRVRLHNHVDALPRFSLLSPIADNVETPPTLAFSYRQFLDDVRYVISIGEWKQFVALSSDSARDRFIEQFWERRNPIPGTPSNRYRDEHYRRLAYADREFRYKDVPGRRTFRGWMYILNGKPDVREVHPGGTNAPSGAESAGLPAEIWRYHVQGPGDDITFEFIDANRDGTFPLVTPPNARVLLPEEEKK
jgi:GWxTD domain-containing protein